VSAASQPLWVPCDECGEFICTKHLMHAHDGECPAIEDMNFDPYSEGGPGESDQ